MRDCDLHRALASQFPLTPADWRDNVLSGILLDLTVRSIDGMRGRRAKVEPKARIAVAYTRVSTMEQAEGGHSLAAQDRRLQALAIANERTIVKTYVDGGVSAASLRRPQLQALLDDVRAGKIAAVYVAKLDRLTRSLRDLLDLVKTFEKHNVVLVSASETVDTGTAAGRMMLSLLGTFAEFERERIGERTRETLGDRRRQGKAYCRRDPFGYRREGTDLIPIPHELAVRDEAQQMFRDGASLRGIGAMLAQRTGRQWAAQTVKDMLTSRMAREAIAAA